MKFPALSFNFRVRALQTVNHFLGIGGVIYCFYTGAYSWLAIALVFFLLFGIFGANIGLHRLFAHRSFETSRPVEVFLAVLGSLTTMGSPIAWAGLHRFHHGHSDVPADPHSPHYVGNIGAWVGFWNKVVIRPVLVKDLTSSNLHRTLHRYYFSVIFAYVAILFLIHPWLPIFAYCIPASLCLQGSSAISVFCHRFGYRNFETADFSFNNWVAWIMSLGEGWHNNHHKYPASHRQGIKPWEIDPSAWIIERILSTKSLKARMHVSSKS